MKLADIKKLHDLLPAHRAALCLDLGADLFKRRRKAQRTGSLPSALRRETITSTAFGPVINLLHGIEGPAPRKVSGLSSTRRRLQTPLGSVPDMVLTPRGRKEAVRRAMDRGKDRSLKDLAIRQLAVGMMDGDPVSRCCAAYAYWQATGAEAALPILRSALASRDEEERMVAAHCLANIDMRHVRDLHGTAKDDEPQTPANPVRNSMTVIIHGTFAKNSSWYKPRGDFHNYIKTKVYPDVYSGSDFYFWSGRYSLSRNGLRRIWRQAARKLVSWCNARPAGTLRLIAHSHGNNVVNMATRLGMPACTLIQLSPPVRSWNLPDMNVVSSDRLFNIHSRIDLVVKLDGGAQGYAGTAVAGVERTKIIAFAGHSDSHDKKKWANKRVPNLVKTVCP